MLVTTLGMLAGLVAMAAAMAIGLARADMLLDRLRRSQDQLAQVTEIRAEVERLRAEVATGAPDIAARVSRVAASLDAYRRSIGEEGQALGAQAGPSQAAEARNAEQMAATFASLRDGLMQGAPAPSEDTARRRFEDLASRVVARERTEARVAGQAMGELRRTFTILAVAIAVLMGVVGLAGIWIARRSSGIETSRQTLAEADRNRRLFVSKLSHELRTPATVIRGEAEVALRDANATPERLREALALVAGNSEFLQRRLEDMLALAGAEDGRIVLRKDLVDLVEIIRSAAALAETYVRANGLKLMLHLAPNGPAEILADASWLQQAVLAILDNAAKFSVEGQAIQLTLSHQTDRLRITVTDCGPGVAPSDLPRLFDSWYQTAEGRARGGTGLGLSVARWVIEQHGGEIRAQSSLGKGLTVAMDLPVRA